MNPPIRRLQAVLKREAKKSAKGVEEAIEALARVHAERLTGLGYLASPTPAVGRLAGALSRLKAVSDLSGRLEIRFPLPKSKAIEPEQFSVRVPEEGDGGVPAVAFQEAIEDLRSRDPIGSRELEFAGLEVERIYGGVEDPQGGFFYPHGFAAAKAVDEEMAARVRDRLVAGMAKGTPTSEIAQELSDEWDWPVSYSATVVRTTINTASTAGRFREAERVARTTGFAVGFTYSAVVDSNVRRGRPQDNGENHLALDGLTARQDDPIWRKFSPPGGFACRCALLVTFDDVPEGFVKIPAGAAFAPGFGGRPDLSGMYR